MNLLKSRQELLARYNVSLPGEYDIDDLNEDIINV
ncbi:hypothetical protein OKW21_005145 [Catalinimonas alkaloidigena]|nr:hypothetical protein [Catalinimonas alkaloidigena]